MDDLLQYLQRVYAGVAEHKDMLRLRVERSGPDVVVCMKPSIDACMRINARSTPHSVSSGFDWLPILFPGVHFEELQTHIQEKRPDALLVAIERWEDPCPSVQPYDIVLRWRERVTHAP